MLDEVAPTVVCLFVPIVLLEDKLRFLGEGMRVAAAPVEDGWCSWLLPVPRFLVLEVPVFDASGLLIAPNDVALLRDDFAEVLPPEQTCCQCRISFVLMQFDVIITFTT